MSSLQNAAPGAKSSKIQGLNPFTPFLAQPGDLDGGDNSGAPEERLSENLDRRLRVTNSNVAATSSGLTQTQYATTNNSLPMQTTSGGVTAPNQELKVEESNNNDEKKTDPPAESDDDSDLEEYDDDDAALEAFRQRRLAELKQVHTKEQKQLGKGHGEVRTITQDEFLPECTKSSSQFVVVHFFHSEFEKCKIMDHHLQIMAKLHLSCKFVRINAEKAPFFVAKLAIQTLPTLLVFRDGKTVDRLLGFEGLSSSKHPDEFPTSRLGRWLESTGAIEYEGPDSDEEDNVGGSSGTRLGMLSSRYSAYDEDV